MLVCTLSKSVAWAIARILPVPGSRIVAAAPRFCLLPTGTALVISFIAAFCIAGFRVVRMVSPPWLIVFRRSAGVLPSTAICGDFCRYSSTKAQKYGCAERWQTPLDRLFLIIFFTATFLAAVTSLALARPSDCIRSSTMLRRVWDSLGLSTGLKAVGCCTMPASRAAWPRLSLLALTPK